MVKSTTKALFCAALVMALFQAGCNSERDWEFTPQIQSAAFIGPDITWLITVNGELLYTRDRGSNWEKKRLENIASFEQLNFSDAEHGWVVNDQGEVLRTTNGGETWAAIAKLDYSNDPFTGPLLQVEFHDEMRGWVLDPFSIWRTEDGGVHWERVFVPADGSSSDKTLHRCYFLNQQTGWACGSGGKIYHTVDGGKTWTAKVMMANGTDLHDIYFIDENKGWVSAWPDGGIYHTVDGGRSWQSQQLPRNSISIHSIHFINENAGWATGNDRTGEAQNDNTRGVIFQTTDGGKSWQNIQSEKKEPFYEKVYFANAQQGWLFARDHVYRTEDGGKTWKMVLNLPSIRNK